MRSRFKSFASILSGSYGVTWAEWQLDIIYDRVDRSGWPTRDRASPEEEC